MKIYSIVRIGNEYVVQADEKSVLKISSKRKAAKLIPDATELLDLQSAPPTAPDATWWRRKPTAPAMCCRCSRG